MTNKPYEVTLWITPKLSLYHASKVISGLCELARDGSIILRTTNRFPFLPSDGDLIWLEVLSAAGDTKIICLDLHDRSDEFDPDGFTFADVYFKRSYHQPEIAKLRPDAKAKIVPFGLNFCCINRSARAFFLSLIWNKFSSGIFRSPWKRLGGLINDLKLLKGVPPAGAFEQDPSTPREATILFQTRVWPPEESTEDLGKINNDRVGLIRSLREVFRDRFMGGVMADDFARRFCPDILAEINIRRAHYSQLVRKATIGVYTRGLHHSLAFKLSEYLAAGMCIVSEPLLFQLPVPLEANVNYIPFTSHAECIAGCRRLLESPDEVVRMRHANVLYYREHVEPKAHVHNLLVRTFAGPK